MSSYATDRKIRIIKEHHGEDWASLFPDRSIDSVYNEVTGDTRKTLFCKVSIENKDKLEHMLRVYHTDIGTLVEKWIEEQYKDFSAQEQTAVAGLADDYS